MKDFAEGKFVTIVMSIVTIFALIGDDIRVWATDKAVDIIFFAGLMMSFVLFASEIMLNTVAIDEFKYSFFFWMDIIATITVLLDIPWVTDPFKATLLDETPDYLSVNVIPGQIIAASGAKNFAKVFRSFKLIRLIRIIKLYKYIVQSGAKQEEDINPKKKKKKKNVQKIQQEKKQEEEESLFKKETDPSKLGKSLSESINKKTIIGTLLILMVLPLLSRAETDYSIEYFLREVFWFGRASCQDPNGFFCHPESEPWLTEEGWYEVLRGAVRAAENS